MLKVFSLGIYQPINVLMHYMLCAEQFLDIDIFFLVTSFW